MIIPIFTSIRLVLMYLPDQNYHWFNLIQLLHIPTWVLVDILQIKFIRQFSDRELWPKSHALLNISLSLGNACGSAIGAFIANEYGLRTVFLYTAPIPLLAYFFLVRILVLLRNQTIDN